MLDMASTTVSEHDLDATLMTEERALVKLMLRPPLLEMARDVPQLLAELI